MERHLRKSRFLYNRRAGTFSLPGRYPAAHKVQGHKEYKVYQVSEMVGFQDEKYFSRQFKKLVGVTPKEYRNEHTSPL